jgi:hypothetical protein
MCQLGNRLPKNLYYLAGPQTDVPRLANGKDRDVAHEPLEAAMKAKNRNLAGNVAPMMPRQNRGTHLTRTFALTAAAAFCFSAGAMAQFNASLTGTVEDNTGASIPGATVTLVDNGTQQKRKATRTMWRSRLKRRAT